MATMPLGARARLDGDAKTLEVLEAAVEPENGRDRGDGGSRDDGCDGSLIGARPCSAATIAAGARRRRGIRRRRQDDLAATAACCGSAGPRTRTTLNPFVGLDEEDYNVWAMNWDLLVNFSPKDLSPAPGIAKSWDGLRRQEDGHLQARPGREVVGRQADHLRGRQVVARGARRQRGPVHQLHRRTSPRSTRPTPTRSWSTRSRPDARIIGGLFIYILPEAHLGQGAAQGADRRLPARAAAGRQRPVHRHRVRARADHHDGAQPELPRRAEPAFDEIQFIKYGNQDAVERALQLGEIDMVRRGRARATSPASATSRTSRRSQRRRPPTPSSRSTSARSDYCPDAKFNPAVQDRDVRQAIAYAIDRERINEIAARDTSFAGHGILPDVLQVVLRAARAGLPVRPRPWRNQILDDAGWVMGDDGVRDEGRRAARVRPLRALRVAVQHPGGEAGRRGGQGDRGRVQRPGGQHRQAHRPDRPEDRRQAGAGLRHLHLGLGRRPVRPELPAQPPHSPSEIGGSSDSFYSNPEYDKLFDEQAGIVRRRRAQGDHPADGRDHPARPALPRPHLRPEPAGLPDRHDRTRSRRSARRTTGDIFCEQVGYDAAARAHTRSRAAASSETAIGQSPGSRSSSAIVFGFIGGVHRHPPEPRPRAEPLELPE